MYAHSKREIINYYNYCITTTLLGKNQLTEDQRSHLLTLLRQLAFSENMKLYQERLNALYQSTVYKKNSSVQNYLQRNWLGCVKVRVNIY